MKSLNYSILIIYLIFIAHAAFARPIEIGPLELAPSAVAKFNYSDNYLKTKEKKSGHVEELGALLGLKYSSERIDLTYNAMIAETYRSFSEDTNEIYNLGGTLKIHSVKGFYISGSDSRFTTNGATIYETTISESRGHKYGGNFGYLDRDKPFKIDVGYHITNYYYDNREEQEKELSVAGTYKFAYHYGIAIGYDELEMFNTKTKSTAITFMWDFSELESILFGLRLMTSEDKKNWGLKFEYHKTFFHDLRAVLRLSRDYYPVTTGVTSVRNSFDLRLTKPLFLASKLFLKLGYDKTDVSDTWDLDYSTYKLELSFLSPFTEYFGYKIEYNFEKKQGSDGGSNTGNTHIGNYTQNNVEFILTYIF